MSSKPETVFVNSVHRHILRSEIHMEGMANPYRGGTPDNYYDAAAWRGLEIYRPISTDLWVEYKFKPKMGLRIDLSNEASKPALSSLQKKWLRRRSENGQNAWVICGFPEGGVIMKSPEEWLRVWGKGELKAAMKSRKEIAQCITNFVLCQSKKP